MLSGQVRVWLGKTSHSKFSHPEINPICTLYINNRIHWLSKVRYLCIHHLSPEYIIRKEWDMMPKRNIPLKLISKLLKILIKRIHTADLHWSTQPNSSLHTTGAKPQALQLWTPARMSPSCGSVSLSRRGLEEIIWIICRKRISRFATQASVHGWSAQSF